MSLPHYTLHLVTLFIFLITSIELPGEENFILLDCSTNNVIYEFGPNIDERVTPCSTFKIPLCLMGFDAGVLKNEAHPRWPYLQGYSDYLKSWKRDQTPATWLKLSCVWYSQVLAGKMGIDKMQDYLNHWQYGNQDLSGDHGENNRPTCAWISSSLKISPREQVCFLQKLIKEELSTSKHATNMTRRLLRIDDEGLFGKTGFGSPGESKEIGWFVGWLEKEGNIYIFAYNIRDQEIVLSSRIPRVKQLLKECLD